MEGEKKDTFEDENADSDSENDKIYTNNTSNYYTKFVGSGREIKGIECQLQIL